MKLKRNDTVKILAGKDKGKSGKIEKIFESNNKIVVENINQYKRHFKARMQNQKSEILTITKPVNVANVGLVCPKCKKITRVGYSIEKGKKIRVCKKCGKGIE